MTTIAFMTRSLEADRIWKGVVETAGRAGVNLMVFYGDLLSGIQSNIIYELLSRKRIDGVITWASSDKNEYLSFYDKLGDIPLVSLSLPLADRPLVAIDNVGGMKNLINHLITVHGRRKIAFIRGPENHIYAQERFQAYRETLAEHRMGFNERLVFQGTWNASSGGEACLEFFETRRLAAGKDIDAIVCVHDHVSLAVAAELKKAGIRIPEDISLTGYDNTRDAHSTTPGLTTMEMPFYEQGEAAVRILLDMIRGKGVLQKIKLDSRPIIQQSCGCPAISRDEKPTAASLQSGLPVLIEAFAREKDHHETGVFISTLQSLLAANSNRDIQFDDWQTLITILQENLAGSNTDKKSLLLVMELAAQARMLLRIAERRRFNRDFLDAEKKLACVRHLSSELMSAVRMSDIREILRQDLPSIGIKDYHLALYENAGSYSFPDPAPAISRIAVSSTGRGEGTVFPSQEILPDVIMKSMPSFSLFIFPLLYKTNQIGFLVIENPPLDKSLYPPLQEQLSSSLNMDKLFQELSETKDKLQNTLAVQKSKTQVISSSSKDIYERIENISTTMEETARSIEAVSRTINDVMDMVSGAAAHGHRITSIINGLKSQSIAVGKVTRFIYDIAEQTNVLSINAAIEAARSGEQGKGFAVVAREVKSLSQKTTSSTDEANRIIKQIQESSGHTVDGVGCILKAIDEISVFSGSITTAISEQSQAVNNISALLVQTTESLKMISNAISEIAGM